MENDDLSNLKAAQAELDASRRRQSVERFSQLYRAWTAEKQPVTSLCSQAGDVLEDYAIETLGALVRAAAAVPQTAAVTTWIVEQYHSGIGAVGAAIRDAIEDSTTRHAVAQTLQARLLHAESRLRVLGNTREPQAPTTSNPIV